MIPTDDKKDKTTDLSSFVEADRKTLQGMGNNLCTSMKDDLTPFKIKKLSEELTVIHNKHFAAGIDDKSQKQWNKVRGAAMSLSNQNEKTYKKFYTDALELGRKILQLAEKLGVVAIPVALSQEPFSFFG